MMLRSSRSPDLVDTAYDEIPTLVNEQPSSSNSAFPPVSSVEQCPITLLTGFLGSGKTTLLE